jgi:hypothetical protein
MKKQHAYMLTDHACRNCGGRILLGPGGGAGAAMVGERFICADCEETHFGDVSGLCWCGFGQRHQQPGEYLCMRLDRAIAEHWLRDAMGHSGVDPDSKKIKVAMVNRQAIRNAEERAKNDYINLEN